MSTVLALVLAAAAAMPGWLGFGFTRHRTGRETWLQVRRVAPGGPAEKAGLRPQDVITSINGRRVTFASDAAAVMFLQQIRAGQRLRLRIRRGAQRREVVLTAVPLSPDKAAQRRRDLERAKARTP